MIHNYLLTALRNVWRNTTASVISIIGFAVSLSACLLVISFIVHQYSYDGWHKDRERIFQINAIKEGEWLPLFAPSPAVISQELRSQAGIESVASLRKLNIDALANNKTLAVGGLFVTGNFFEVFDFSNSGSSLKEPFTALITKSCAEKFFNNLDPQNKSISLGDWGSFTIIGVIPDPPTNSHIKFEILVSYSTLVSLERDKKVPQSLQNWGDVKTTYNYVRLEANAAASVLDPILKSISMRHELSDKKITLSYTPLTQINPTSVSYSYRLSPQMPTILLVFISILVLLIIGAAGFNYMNLSLARLLNRAREVGIRKVAGANRSQLFIQFILESVLTTLFSLIIALGLWQYLKLEIVNHLDSDARQIIDFADTPIVYIYFLLFTLLVGLLTGTAPAIILSKLSPAIVLKNLANIKVFSRLSLQRSLVVVQFIFSLLFIITTLVVYKQFAYSLKSDIGFNYENVLKVKIQSPEYKLFMQKAGENPEVESMSVSAGSIGVNSAWFGKIRNEQMTDSMNFAYLAVDQDYISTMKLELVAGHNFEILGEEEKEIILNQTAAKALNLGSPTEALGKIVIVDNKELHVIGVLKDFYNRGIGHSTDIFALRYLPEEFGFINLRLRSGNIKLVSELQGDWIKTIGEKPFSWSFVKTDIHQSMAAYTIASSVIGSLGLLGISIASLGLIGMVNYSMKTRAKEVGVRKVMGASTFQLSLLLTSGFARLLLIASLITLPFAYFVNNLWLESLPNHTTISWSMMLLALGLMWIIGIAATFSQTWAAASMNPVKTLRNE